MMNTNCRRGCTGREDLRLTYQAALVSRRPALDSWAAARADTPGSVSAKSSRASASRRLAACPARLLAASDHPNRAAMFANSAEPSRQQEVYPRRNPDKVRPNPELGCPEGLLVAFCYLAAKA